MNKRYLRVLASPLQSEDNPFQSLLYKSLEKNNIHVSTVATHKLLQGSWDVWHLHWPENIVNQRYLRSIILPLLKLWIRLKLARLHKTKIFWTAHNLQSHERIHPFLERLFWHKFLSNVDGIICLSEVGKQQLRVQHPRTRLIPTFAIPHGHYRGAYPDVINKDEARRALSIRPDEFVLTFLGQIRAYKGVAPLVRCFTAAQVENVKLLIAGKPFDDGIMCEINEAAALNPSVTLFPKFVDRNDIQKILRATDLVVLPYKEILNSGSGMLALSFDRPILVPTMGAMAELREIVGSDWVRLYEGELSPEIMRSAIDWTKARRLGPDVRAPLEPMNWDRIAELTIQAFLLDKTLQQSHHL